MKKDNKGFSLVELIVVVAILSILVGVMAYNIGRLSGYRAKECRSKVMSSLDNGRTMSLSKSRGGSNLDNTNTYLVFFKNSADGSNYCLSVEEGVVKDVKKISKGNVTLEYSYTQDATSGTPVPVLGLEKNLSMNTATATLEAARDGGLKVGFSRQNGAFLPTGSGDYCYHFFATAGLYRYGITVHPKTGKVESGERTRATSQYKIGFDGIKEDI